MTTAPKILKITGYVPEKDPLEQGLFEYAVEAYGLMASDIHELRRADELRKAEAKKEPSYEPTIPTTINTDAFRDKPRHSFEAMTNMLENLICDSSQPVTECLLNKSSLDGNTPVSDPETVAYAIIMQHLHLRVNMHAGMKPKAWLAQRQLKEDDDVTGDRVAKVCFSDEIAETVYDNWLYEAMKNDMKAFK